jgi:hypothetical protein
MRQTTRVLSVLATLVAGAVLAVAPPASATTPTTTELASDVNPSVVGEAVTLTATVTGDSPTGTVSFDDGGSDLGDGTLNGAGVATLVTSSLSVGDHEITATYEGDPGNDVSSDVLTQTVEAAPPADTTTVLESSANPSTEGEAVTLTATVTGDSPTGTVSFDDGGSDLGDGTLNGAGVATLVTSSLSVGDHEITATYEGDSGNDGSSSVALTQTVQAVPPAVTTTVLTSNLNPSTVGQNVTLTATVTGASPTGTVTFKDGATVLGTPSMASGGASLVVGTFTAGGHALTATYNGDPDNAPSTGSLTQTVVAPVVPPTTPTTPTPPAPVAKPKVTLHVSTVKASVGDKVKLTWRSKHADSVMASGDWGGAQQAHGSKQVRLTERGKHVFRLTVQNASGTKTAKVVVMASRKAKELELVVTDELVLVGTDVQVTADGLAKGETYTVRLDGKPVLSGKADKKGDVVRTFELAKTTQEGALALTITGSNPNRVGETVLNVLRPKTLDVQVALDELVKKADQTVTVTGLAAGEEVKVMYAGKQLTVGEADESGEFTYVFNVGTDKGERTVKVIGAFPTRVGEATFTVTGNGNGTGAGDDGGGGGGDDGGTPSGRAQAPVV